MLNIHRFTILVISAAAIDLLASPGSSNAATNVAYLAPVIGGSGDYQNSDFNLGAPFQSLNVTDGQDAINPDTGGIVEPSGDGSFWLGRDGVQTGYFVLDLGTPRNVVQLELFNTRNGRFDDRGTGDFTISASNAVAFVNANTGFDLVGGVQIAAGHLTPQTYAGSPNTYQSAPVPDPLIPNFFNASNTGPFRYLRFNALNVGAANDKGFPANGGVGLNEIRVFETFVPEPASIVMLGVASGIGCLVRRRQIEKNLDRL